jgi:HK97 family phage major capsid protein
MPHIDGRAFVASTFAVPDPDTLAAAAADLDGPPVVITAVALPWDRTVPLNWWGDTVAFDQGSVDTSGDPARVPFLRDHVGAGTHLMGTVTGWSDRPDGLHAAAAVPRAELAEPETARALRQIRSGIRNGVSVRVEWSDENSTRTPINGSRYAEHHQVHAGARISELSSVVLPRFDDARVTGVAAAALTADTPPDPADDDDDDVDVDPTEEATTQPDDPGEPDMTDTATADLDLEAARLATHRQVLAASVAGADRRPVVRDTRHLGQFAWDLLRDGPGAARDAAMRQLAAALTDEISSDVPGLVHDVWISTVTQIVASTSPTVQAFRRIPLPDTGMTVNLPVVRNMPPLGQQTTEKSAVASGKLDVTPATFPVNTYAGGQDISLATLMRSDPSYMTIVMAAWATEMAGQMEQFAATTIAAGATAGPNWPTGITDIADPFITVAGSLLTAIGRLPEVAVLAVDVWETMAKAKDTQGRYLFPSLGPVNAAGTVDATAASGSVRGLTYFVSNQLPAGTAVVGVPEAFTSLIGAPIMLGPVDNVAQAGRDVGVAVFAACGVVDQRGVYSITGTLPTPTAADTPPAQTGRGRSS